ncbi:MAG TPA: hypothetical protein VL461_02425 [Dictyobacter sp.]|nr:hypothetical protein [Dictyobacter sp.]
MAATMPSHIPRTTEPDHLVTVLRPWSRRLLLQQTIMWALGGLISGLCIASLLLLGARLFPWATAPYWAAGCILVCTLMTIGYSIWDRPSLVTTAHQIDRRLVLHDRVSTAWELRTQSSPFTNLQLQNTLTHLQAHTPGQTISLQPRRITLATITGILVLLTLLYFLPNPMQSILQQRAALHAQITKQISTIDKIRQNVQKQPDLSDADKKQLDQTLHDVETQLQHAQNETDAQQALANAQAKINQLHDPQASAKLQSQVDAGKSLQSSNNSGAQALGQALAKNDPQGVDKALQKISSQANSLSNGQRQQLAQDLEQAANQSNQSSQLSSSLHQLAKSLTDGDTSEVSDATKAVSSSAQQTQTTQNQENTLNQTSQDLQQAANNLAAANNNTNQGQGQNQNQGQSPNQNQGQGQNQKQGQGQNPNQNQGQGQSQNQGQGQGHGNGNGQNGGGKQQGKSEQVYVQGQNGQGTSTESNGGSGNVQSGSNVPYSQVIQHYNQQAHDAIDNSNVSPNLKDAVHNYFDNLEGQQ